MRPLHLPKALQLIWSSADTPEQLTGSVLPLYKKLRGQASAAPVVSVVIPAYNEAENLVKTLWALCASQCPWPVEIVVVNNNSTDATAALAQACGVQLIHQPIQGITPTRNAGLAAAQGQIVLNADADTLYPPEWIFLMAQPLLTNPKVALTYGRFSFIPTGVTARSTYWLYEYGADAMRYTNRYLKDEAVNVYGFNSGFRREQGIAVDFFNHPPGTNEDGWLAVKLRKAGYGSLHYVRQTKALVWTTDRRIQIDGGLVKATIRRIKRMFFGGPR